MYAFYHFLILLCYIYVTSYDYLFMKAGTDTYGGKSKYLTFWNEILQTIYFGLAFIVDVLGQSGNPLNEKKSSGFKRWRDNFLSVIAFPVGTFVVLTFWSIYAIDRELVYPRHLDKTNPIWLNHATHTTVLPILLLEKYLIYHRHPCKRDGMLALVFFASVYASWIFWIAYYADLWVYPVLKVLQFHERVIFIILLYIFFISIYILGEAITKFFWRNQISRVQKKIN